MATVTGITPMLPDFTRIAWASPQAQSVWAERVRHVSQAWEQIERLSVLDGLRSSALQNIAPEALPLVSAWAASVGLHALLLEQVGVSGIYSASHVPLDAAKAWAYRVAIATPAAALRWPTAWRDRDDEAIGRLLGFPACCRQFFARTWGAGMVDTTAAMEQGHGPREANILLRWMGVRAVTHLPCSVTCAESVRIGSKFIVCGRQHRFTAEMDWLEAMLDWPVEWSSLHGIAEIVTPVCRIQTRTNDSATKQTVKREGVAPAEAANRVQPLVFVDSREWTDNGFSSKAAMDAAHARLLAAAGPGPFRCVLDLGCGNGALLAKMPARRRIGVENDEAHAHRARQRLDAVWLGDCTGTDAWAIPPVEQPDLIIAQAHRNPPEQFPGYAVLSYSYDAPTFARLIHVPERVAV